MARLVIKQHQPYRPLMYFGGSLLLFIVALVAIVDYAEWRFLLGTMSLAGEQQQAIADNLKLRKDNRRLADEAAQLKRTVQIDAEARREAQRMIADLELEVSELKREVSFYRDVFESTEAKGGPKVQGARLQAMPEDGHYLLAIVLTHMGSGSKSATGRLSVSVVGETDGNEAVLGLSDLVVEPFTRDFEFKHFYLNEAEFVLPEGFAPKRVTVELARAGGGKNVSSVTYPWARLLR